MAVAVGSPRAKAAAGHLATRRAIGPDGVSGTTDLPGAPIRHGPSSQHPIVAGRHPPAVVARSVLTRVRLTTARSSCTSCGTFDAGTTPAALLAAMPDR
jgi:hypothetical protein